MIWASGVEEDGGNKWLNQAPEGEDQAIADPATANVRASPEGGWAGGNSYCNA